MPGQAGKPDPATTGAASRSRTLLSSAFPWPSLAWPAARDSLVLAPCLVERGTQRRGSGNRSPRMGVQAWVSRAVDSPLNSRIPQGPVPDPVRLGLRHTRPGSTRQDRTSADRRAPAFPTRSSLTGVPVIPLGGGPAL
jgi:hypothetical protein